MPAKLPAAFFSAVLADYSISDAALAVTNVPTATQVQRRTLESADAIVHPHVLFEFEVDPESTDTLLNLSLKMQLVINVGTESGQTTRAQAMLWLQALRALLDDDHRSTWQTFIEAQTTDYRTGWHIQAIWPQAITADYAEEQHLLTLTAPFTLVSFWNN